MALDPAIIEKLRENSRIRLDRDGRFFHEDVLVEHPLVALAFHRGLGRAPDGRPTITVGRTWCYIQAESTLYIVRAALCDVDATGALRSCLLRLDDGTEESVELRESSIAIDDAGVLYLRVKSGREWARLLPSAQAELGRWVEADAEGRPVFRTMSGPVHPAVLDLEELRSPAAS
jgi:hypothetical protein